MNTYDLEIYSYKGDGSTYIETVQAETASKAKGEFIRQNNEMFYGNTFLEALRRIKSVRCVGKFKASDLFTTDNEMFDHVKEQRGIEFIYVGMRVEMEGKPGVICGNCGLNLAVCFDGNYWTENCHPYWRMKYFDNAGNLIKEFTGD